MDSIYDMHYGSNAFTFKRAEELRKNLTPAEKKLWMHLRKGQILGLKFRRQHPINRFIVDFYCHEKKLVIELDGEIHLMKDAQENDIEREAELKDFGLSIIRFKNNEVLKNIKSVLSEIEQSITKL